MTLHELGQKHETDKWDHSHTFMGESYLHIYERYLEPLRGMRLNFLELGVRNGNSLRMWKEYFPHARIFGVDFNAQCKQHEEDRIEILIASQDDESQLGSLADSAGGFDIILDDASHINHLTHASFQILFPRLKSHGFYIMEDLGMSWVDYSEHADDPAYMEGVLKTHQERGISIHNDREDLEKLFRKLLFDMDMNRGDVHYLHFWSKIAVMKKGA
ncbi:MAG: class I SAM-dependent methyltransferase [Alphaproteobacteria bacterium]|nr:class I SAM-dependent methyltransferase [Alphaproteobacteria bacterium]